MRKMVSLISVGVLLIVTAAAGNAHQPKVAGSSSSVSSWQLDIARPASQTLKCPGIKIPITYEMVSGFGPGKQVTAQWYNAGKKDAKQTMTGDAQGWHLIGQGKNFYKYGQPSSAETDGKQWRMFMGSNSGAAARWWHQGILDPDQVVEDACDQFTEDIKFSKKSFRITVKSIVVLFVSRAGTFDGRGGTNMK